MLRRRQVQLGARELNLLTELLRHRGRVVSYKQLNIQIWGVNQPELTRCLRLTILRLRKKLITEHIDEIQIFNIGGLGYRARVGTAEPNSPFAADLVIRNNGYAKIVEQARVLHDQGGKLMPNS